MEQISANIEQDNTPVVLPNGQILYTRWEYIDRSQVDFHHLWMMNPDGTRQTVYMGNQTESVPGACLLIDARPIPESNEVLTVYSWGHGANEHGGALTLINPSKGPDEKSQIKPFYGQEQGVFYDPYPYSSTHFTVSNSEQVFLGTFKQDPYETLFELTEDQKKAGMCLFEPRPIQRTKRPLVIPDMVDSKKDYGEMILFDVYQGRNMEGVERGIVKYLLVLESLPKPINFTGGPEPTSYGGTFTLERVVGIVPVEEDGSAYMKLPKDRAFFFVALDKDMSAVQRMQSFTSVRGGEIISCIGCHETRQEAPMAQNSQHTPMALRKSAVEPQSVSGIPEVFDFPRDIQPILDKHCIGCHNADKRSGGKNLTSDDGPVYTYGYFTLVGGLQVADGNNSKLKKKGLRAVGDAKSALMNKVLGKHHDVVLSDEEIRKLRFWINAGASFPGTYAALGSGMIGRMYANGVDRTITHDPAIVKAAETIKTSCVSCHSHIPRTICDEGPMTMEWSRHDMSQGSKKIEDYHRDIQYVRHALYNLTNPEQSALLKAPLAKESGGYGLCKGEDGKPIFASKDDPRYQILLEAVKVGQKELNRMSRFNRPDFVPDPAYTRQMKAYHILDKNHEEGKPYNVYKIDQQYWKSLW